MDEDFLKRLIYVVQTSGQKKKDFAEKSGISASYLTDILKGRTNPSERVIRDICTGNSLNESWLFTGEGEIHPTSSKPTLYPGEEARTGPDPQVLEVPFCYTTGPQKLTGWEIRLLIAYRGLTDDQQKDKLFEVEALAQRNESRRNAGGGSSSAATNSA